jgi:type I restriction enzyme, S subunit
LNLDKKINEDDLPLALIQAEVHNWDDLMASIDSRIEILKQKREFLEQKRIGMMEKLISQKIRFSDDDGNEYPDWTVSTLSDLVSLMTIGTDGTFVEVRETNLFLLNSEFIIDGKIELDHYVKQVSKHDFKSNTSSINIEMGDVLLTIKGIIGRSCLSFGESNVAIDNSIALLRFKQDNPLYMLVYFNSSRFQNELVKRKSDSTIPQIDLSEVAKIPVPIPSQAEQYKIGSYISDLNQKIDDVKSYIFVLNKIKNEYLHEQTMNMSESL